MNTSMDQMPVATARAVVMEQRYAKAGTECPCCGRYAKVYRRSITLSQVKFLARLYNIARKRDPANPTGVWVKTGIPEAGREKETLATRGGDYAKLRWAPWSLIEEREGERPDGSARVGYWRITERGIEFLLGAVRLPKYVYEWDNVPVQPPGAEPPPMINVYDVAKQFDFTSIMEAA